MTTQTCQHCQQAFLDHISPIFSGTKYQVPKPTLCHNCRQRLRFQWRNEVNLYKRICDGTGDPTLSVYSEDKPYQIYKVEHWHSDKWEYILNLLQQSKTI